MAETWARQRVAEAWCTPQTSGTEMDIILGDAFADILQTEIEAAVRWGWNQIGALTENDVIARYKAEREKEHHEGPA